MPRHSQYLLSAAPPAHALPSTSINSMDVTPPDSRRQSESDCNGVADLTFKFGAQSIHSYSRFAPTTCDLPLSPHSIDIPSFDPSHFQRGPPTPPAEPLAPSSCAFGYFEPTFSFAPPRRSAVAVSEPCERNTSSRPTSSYQGASASSIRAQRQKLVRRQCSSSHLKEIRDLVARMVENGELCDIHSSDAASPSASTHSNEECETAMIMDDDDDETGDDDEQPCVASKTPSSSTICALSSTGDRGSHSCVRKAHRQKRRSRRRGAMSLT